ncbi:hypothetical protein BU26DRAFT_601227 [Trematosphaeria pertusa]|uniref:Uncharacterized protein n=1 Tax=Trematosphaeria pertusa TaxID=390896 RepID=A0A6A6IRD9_9PLEO|nr:uncharacterized protein BU26DRAFT_601227 [Trematosphaeria pertusa]KAF2253031.1 hypothetical protein BU26DRAFT_601227 [Trematosphaeria pertusa]
MTSAVDHDDQWTIVNPPNTMATTNTSDSQIMAPAPAPTTEQQPQIELTINTKPTSSAAAEKQPEPPKLAREATADSIDDFAEQRARPIRRTTGGPRRYSPSPPPVRIFNNRRDDPVSVMLHSSSQLLENVTKYDGIADMPYPGRSSVYLATFPFSERDVKKWSWLFAHGVEDVWLSQVGGDEDEDAEEEEEYERFGRRVGRVVRSRRRDRSPYYDTVPAIDIPSVYLSRALDAAVVPETKDGSVRYLIVAQNRYRPHGAKLLVAESRKAAGIMMYYEALTGNSVVFVGAIVGGVGKKMKKFKKAEGVDEANAMAGEGVVGVVC